MLPAPDASLCTLNLFFSASAQSKTWPSSCHRSAACCQAKHQPQMPIRQGVSAGDSVFRGQGSELAGTQGELDKHATHQVAVSSCMHKSVCGQQCSWSGVVCASMPVHALKRPQVWCSSWTHFLNRSCRPTRSPEYFTSHSTWS